MKEETVHPKLREGKIDSERIDKGCSTYLEIRQYIDERIDLLRRKNDNHANETNTAALRGGIAELNKLITKLEPKNIQYVSQN